MSPPGGGAARPSTDLAADEARGEAGSANASRLGEEAFAESKEEAKEDADESDERPNLLMKPAKKMMKLKA